MIDFSTLTIKGECYTDTLHRIAYATDGSAYSEMPMAVAVPLDEADIYTLINFANKQHITLIPRAAGTSLAGQVVGSGLVVDVSKHLNRILEINAEEHWVRVQPGVVRDELNLALKPYGLFFAPETSTSNRCCIGGMVGNNSCGLHSLRYGSTRDHLLEATVLLSDGSRCVFESLQPDEIRKKIQLDTLEGRIYKHITTLLDDADVRLLLQNNFPDRTLRRRNNGYALDLLMYCNFFDPSQPEPFNMCKLLAGSEGTLAFATEFKLHLEPLPPTHNMLICVHCDTLEEAYTGNLIALKHAPVAIELMDDKILELSLQNTLQRQNRFFLQGTPKAVLMIELAENSAEELQQKADTVEADLRTGHCGYAYPRVLGNDIKRVWNLRKAGLGILGNMKGDAKPVPVIEDTAVAPSELSAYMADFNAMLKHYGLSCVYYAHIATGELHLRPILNLKSAEGRRLFRAVATQTAILVKKHRGSLSGEHGDGRLRGEFIPLMFGEAVYAHLKALKQSFDPHNIFNAGKIIDTPPMDTHLRYHQAIVMNEVPTYFDFSHKMGWMRAIEQCNGTGECRRSQLFGGTMCPAFRASHNESDTTRARANMLRTLLTNDSALKFDQQEILTVLDNCLSCKACRNECPSSIDMTRLKAEFMQHHFDSNRVPLNTRLIANMPTLLQKASMAPKIYNFFAKNKQMASLTKHLLHFAPERTLPQLADTSLRRWLRHQPKHVGRTVWLFADEFTNFIDVPIGQAFIKLLWHLGYNVQIPKHAESGRTALSKGLLRKARHVAEYNVRQLHNLVTDDAPLVGLEPSCMLSFRDEYPDLVSDALKPLARDLSCHTLLYDEFIEREIAAGRITTMQFTDKAAHVLLHGHCHQKSLASVSATQHILRLPINYHVDIIPSGCCGMAGAFGYERNHYATSQVIGNQTLFPTIRAASQDTLIAAPGTSCRQQILDGTGRHALHPVQILFNALKCNEPRF